MLHWCQRFIAQCGRHAGKGALAILAASAVSTASPAEPPAGAAAASLPAEKAYGSIRYTTGGVTQDEAAAFKRARRAYPLSIELLEQEPGSRRTQYTADALVRIANPAGETVFEARADGPFMLVRLADGRYAVSATLGERTLVKKNVAVGSGDDKGTAQASFVFPASSQ